MKAYINKTSVTDVINIKPCDAVFSEKELNKCVDQFNDETQALEFVVGILRFGASTKNVFSPSFLSPINLTFHSPLVPLNSIALVFNYPTKKTRILL